MKSLQGQIKGVEGYFTRKVVSRVSSDIKNKNNFLKYFLIYCLYYECFRQESERIRALAIIIY